MIVTIESIDGEQIKVSKEIATQSSVIRNMLEDLNESDAAIPLPLPRNILKRVFGCSNERHAPSDTLIDLVHIVIAADYLDIGPLVSTAGKSAGEWLLGNTAQDILAFFGTPNPFTKAEEIWYNRQSKIHARPDRVLTPGESCPVPTSVLFAILEAPRSDLLWRLEEALGRGRVDDVDDVPAQDISVSLRSTPITPEYPDRVLHVRSDLATIADELSTRIYRTYPIPAPLWPTLVVDLESIPHVSSIVLQSARDRYGRSVPAYILIAGSPGVQAPVRGRCFFEDGTLLKYDTVIFKSTQKYLICMDWNQMDAL